MRRRAPRIGLGVAVALGLAACGGTTPRDDEPERCDVPFTVPSGFEVTGGIEDPYPDRIGVRVDMDGQGDAELHFFAGIPGEFGEGLPEAGSFPTEAGGRASLLGRDDVWVLVADGTGCSQTAVLGSGIGRRGFVELLREAGAVAG